MKKLKKYNQFINESNKLNIEPPKKDSKFKFLMDICKKANYEQTNHFYVKDLIEIGTGKKMVYYK